ncbi:DUF1501 domain-containing protein [Telluribacter sp.]|jgi:uncharacterized protein (DUF1501 family)|uniref:DUF1501 domain-containing protein n=1 Tax=Telluribacter sp. TaxID=1978767 RepID=UPI002E15A15D|nr:DUF1501 domain-containing protein [Telluribacter sp.]
MNRRTFLQKSAFSAILPWALNGFGARAYSSQASAFLSALSTTSEINDRVLIVIQLNGGNDGLNTVIPLDQMGLYNNLRTTIAIPENKVLKLANRLDAGLHPSMSGFQNLYSDGQLAIVENVGYANPSFSHFEANDIWFKASTNTNSLSSGWLGRYLDARFTNYPGGYPNDTMPDPLAIQISSVPSTALLGPNQSVALAIQDINTFARLIGERPASAPETGGKLAREYLTFIREQQVSSVAYAKQLQSAAAKGANQVSYPTGNRLSEQLRVIARLLHGGLKTKVFYVSLGGFDTHSGQVDTGDKTQGVHANLLRQLSEAVKAFQGDLKVMGLADRVVGITFSEFGRRAQSNGSRGTDHGWASPQFVFGEAVKTQWIGRTPDLKNLEKNNVRIQTDFRQLYATLLTDWFGANEATVRKVLLGTDYEILPIFQDPILSTAPPEADRWVVYPNPCRTEATLEWPEGEQVQRILLTDIAGREVPVQSVPVRSNQAIVRVNQLPAGRYTLTFQTGKGHIHRPLLVVP